MDIQDTYTLRGICMLMIIIHHVLKYAEWAPIPIRGIWGDMGTAVFFFISGWGLYCSMEKKERVDLDYLLQNMKKLLVPFLIVWAITEVAYQIIHSEIEWSGYGRIWFIQVITGAYIVSILTFMIVKWRILRLTIVLILCLTYIYIGWKVLCLPQYRWGSVICFPAGMWLSAYRRELKPVLEQKWAIAIISLFLYWLFRNYDFLPLRACLKYSIPFCLLFVSLGSIVNIQSKLLYFIGKNSLLFYLIHIALLLLLRESEYMCEHYILTLCVVFIGTVALSWIYKKVQELISARE
ncbi:acyltransferase family protein [Pseudobutyrivibrio sp.]|uniref:acyltransferase family protein n=1 Tax=Pseudobutyrivibrio sp. TaxID=2014367 RepID=UPI00386A8308